MNTPSEILDRLPPQDLEAEKNLLGSILADSRVLDRLDLDPLEFYADANQKVFARLLDMQRRRVGIDVLTLSREIEKAGELAYIGGAAYLYELHTSITLYPDYAAKIVRERAKARSIIHAATEAMRNAWDTRMPVQDTLDALERDVQAIGRSETINVVLNAEQAAAAAICRVDELAKRKDGMGVSSGFLSFDVTIGGFFPGELTIMAARLGIGKSALAAQIANHNADRGRLVYFASMEMEAADLTLRMLCTSAGVDSRYVRTGKLTTDDYRRLAEEANRFSRRAIRIDERPDVKVADIRRTVRRLVKDGLQFVVIDYLQFINPDNPKDPEQQQFARIVRSLKSLARELKVPVLVLCQLNRESEKEGKASARHLAGSDVIGRTADVVSIIEVTQPQEATKSTVPRDATWKVVKNRFGPQGIIELTWVPAYTRFSCREDLPAEQRDNYEPAFEGSF